MYKEIALLNTAELAASMEHDLGVKKMHEAEEVAKEAKEEELKETVKDFAAELQIAEEKRKAAAAAEAAEMQRMQQLQNLFRSLGAKHRLTAALHHGDAKVALESAAEVVQALWRSKIAQRRVLSLREERDRLVMLRCVHKLQAHIRKTIAKKKVAQLKAEQQQVRAISNTLILNKNFIVTNVLIQYKTSTNSVLIQY